MNLPKLPNVDFKAVARRIASIVEKLCDHPEHLQRLAIIFAGVFAYPLVWGLVFIVWKGFDSKVFGAKQLEILGQALMGSMVLWGLVIVALLGIVKGVKAQLPGGAGFEVDIDNTKEADNGNSSSK